MPKFIFKRVNCKFRFPTALEDNTNSWSASLALGTSPPEFPLKWQGRGQHGMGWVEKQRSRMWRKWEFRYRETFFFPYLNDKENMANSSSEHVPLPITSAQAHRAEILENPLRVSLFNFHIVCSGEGGESWYGAQHNDVMWDSCPGNSYYSWSFQRLWKRFHV